VELSELPGIVVDDTQARKVGEWTHSLKYPTYIGEGYLHDGNLGKGEKTLTFMPKITKAGRYDVRLAYISTVGRADNAPVHIMHADGEEDITVDQSTLPPVDGRFISLGQFRFEAGGQGYVMISNEGTKGHVTADAVVFVPVEELAELEAKEEKNANQDPLLAAAEKRVKQLDAELKKLQKEGPQRPEAMASKTIVAPCEKPTRATRSSRPAKPCAAIWLRSSVSSAPRAAATRAGRFARVTPVRLCHCPRAGLSS
jgi:hypothetical protein